MPAAETLSALAEKIDRLDSIEQIRQIAYQYSIAIDARDLDALVGLYVDDIKVGKDQVGREALKAIFDKSLRQFTASAHQVSNHVIEFIDADNALGLVTSRVEHEVGPDWVTAVMMYHDRYVRRAGSWYLRGRVQARLYATGQDDVPVGPDKIRWPGAKPAPGQFHDPFPSWTEFWDQTAAAPANDRSGASSPAGGFITKLRRTRALPPPPKYIF